jgi:type IV pilus assembly protein PilQ
MKIYSSIKLLLTLSLLTLLFSGCSTIDRPNTSQKDKNKIAGQDIENFDVKNTAEAFRDINKKFAQDAKDILRRENVNKKASVRRISLTNSELPKQALKVVDQNLVIKQLETTEVSLKLNSMNVKAALKLFASLVQRNIIIGEEVDGEITIDFENIKWGSAVYAILDINSLIMTVDKDSGLLRVHSKEFYAELEKSKIERTLLVSKNTATLENGGSSSTSTDGEITQPTVTEVFKIFYQTSADMLTPISEVLPNEDIAIVDDAKNNQLLVTGTYAQLSKVESLLDKIDIEKKQVMIEAYIVNTTDGFAKSFSASLVAANVQNVQAGRDRITYVGVDTAPDASGTIFKTDLAVTEGAANSTYEDPGALAGGAFILGNLGMTKLKAIIQSSVNDTYTETIANPKLFAMDGESSSLTQGVTLVQIIPASGDAAGSTVEIPQNLTISVTPVITGDDIVKLELNLANDSPGDSTATGVVTNEESITSIVQVNNGDVAILGGVYKNTKTDSKKYVPFLSSIPILGEFFKSKTNKDDKTQLLIFLSANVV